MKTGPVTLALALSACSLPSTTQEEGKPAPRAVAPAPSEPTCQPATVNGVWARFEGEPCDWELRDAGDDGLELVNLATEDPTSARGQPPVDCGSQICVYQGVASAAGPAVLAVVPSTASEMPSGVQLGVVAGEQLVFVDLWEGAGDPVDRDLTRVGPVHALAPFSCGERLAVLPVERLDGARGMAPPPSLTARAGLLDASDPTAAPSAAPSDCTPLALPIP